MEERLLQTQNIQQHRERETLPDKNQQVKEMELLAFWGRGAAATAGASSSRWPTELVNILRET